jgi:hypothetical protein
LLALGLGNDNRVVFIPAADFHSKFDVPLTTVTKELQCLSDLGAELLSVPEVLRSAQPLRLVWTVPAEQSDPAEPQAHEHKAPAAGEKPGPLQVLSEC